jgi:hypothetical protein
MIQVVFNVLAFENICDRFVDLLPRIIDGHIHTDETECEQLACRNLYTKCNFIRNCPQGEDEENCSNNFCPSNSMICALPENYTMGCLAKDRIADGQMDCLGGFDETFTCPSIYSAISNSRWYRCFNQTNCLMTAQLCNGIRA